MTRYNRLTVLMRNLTHHIRASAIHTTEARCIEWCPPNRGRDWFGFSSGGLLIVVERWCMEAMEPLNTVSSDSISHMLATYMERSPIWHVQTYRTRECVRRGLYQAYKGQVQYCTVSCGGRVSRVFRAEAVRGWVGGNSIA